MTAPICFLDIESDGVHPGRHPWEIAMIRREPDGTQRETTFFVDIDLATADPFGLRVGRFYDRHPLGRRLAHGPGAARGTAKKRRDAAFLVAEYTHGAQIVGAVPNFDAETLANLLRAEGFTPAWSHRLRCVETLATGHLHRNTGGLTSTAAALGITVPDTEVHTALGDTRTAMRIYDRVMNGTT